MIASRFRADFPPLPDSLAGYVAVAGSAVHTIRDKAFDGVFLSWMQRCTRIDPAAHMVVVGPEVVAAMLLAEAAAARQHAGTETSGGEDEANLQRARALLVRAAQLGASDIHVLLRELFTDVQVRIKGSLRVLDRLPVAEGRQIERTLVQGFASTKDASYNPGDFQNAQIAGEDIDPSLTGIRLVRGPAYPVDKGGGFLVGRLQYRSSILGATAHHTRLPVPEAPRPADLKLDTLGYTEAQLVELRDMLDANCGIIVVTGPTGSGKTTLIHELMKTHAMRFPELRQVTIEDPIEYPMAWAVQMAITNASNEADTADAFAERLRTALRMDPDTILVGEVRGAGSALAALNAAMTGHLIFATLHTTDPYMAIDRMELMDPVRLNRKVTCDHNLILGLIAQRLLPRLCPHCRVPFSPRDLGAETVRKLEAWGDLGSTFQRGQGCQHCAEDGYVGRFAVGEVLRTDGALMRDMAMHGTDVARHAMRMRQGFSGSVLRNAMAAVLQGWVSPLDVRMAASIVPPEEDA